MSKKNQQKLYDFNEDDLLKMIDQELVNTNAKPKTKKEKTKWLSFDSQEKKSLKSETQRKEVQNLLAADHYQYKEVLGHSKTIAERTRLEKENNDREMERAIRMSKEAEERRIAALKEEEERKRAEIKRFRKLEYERLQEKLMDTFRFNYLLETDFDKIAHYLNEYETNTNTFLNDFSIERSSKSMNGKSALIIDVIKVLRYSNQFNIKKIIKSSSKHLEDIRRTCQDKKDFLFSYNAEIHELDKTSQFSHKSIDDKLKAIDIRGDGNCLWNSISTALFGDYSMMESLRVLTAYILLENETKFTDYFNKQESKYGYRPELSFDELVNASTELQVWGDEHHILALSLALNRPIYSYGSLANIDISYDESYDDFKKNYESDSLPNHFQYIADDLFDNRKPILLYYNGENHYNVVLPTDDSVAPPVPKSQLLEPIIVFKSKTKESEQSTSQAKATDKTQTKSCNRKDFESSKTTEIVEKSIYIQNNFKDSEAINECETRVCEMTVIETNELQQLRQELENAKSYVETIVIERDHLRSHNNSLEIKIKEMEKRHNSLLRYVINKKESDESEAHRPQIPAIDVKHNSSKQYSQLLYENGCTSLRQSVHNYSKTYSNENSVAVPQTRSRTERKDSEEYEDEDYSEMETDQNETDL